MSGPGYTRVHQKTGPRSWGRPPFRRAARRPGWTSIAIHAEEIVMGRNVLAAVAVAVLVSTLTPAATAAAAPAVPAAPAAPAPALRWGACPPEQPGIPR